MNKKQLFVVFSILLVFASAVEQAEDEDHYTINEASDLLHELLQDSKVKLNELEAAWEVKKPLLEQDIANLEKDLAHKQEQCDGLDQVLEHREKELADAEDYVAWLKKKIQENTDRIQQILSQRCEQNGNYIESLKNDKLALKLLQFIREHIESKDSFNFAQRKQFMSQLHSFLAIYKTGNYDELVLLQQNLVDASEYNVNTDSSVSDRTESEIGTGHVDNDQQDLKLEDFQNGQRKGWLQIKQELVDLLNNLEKQIREKMAQAQEDEVRSSSAAADFKIQLEHEIQVFQKDLAAWEIKVTELKAAVEQDKENVKECRQQEASLSGQLAQAKQQLQDETDEYNRKLGAYNEEVAIFTEVVALYDEANTNQGDDFKSRAEDYIDNQQFDNGNYADREVPDIDLIGSQ